MERFTYYLLEALHGKADYARKGFVTVYDLQTYVVDCLRRWYVKYGRSPQETTARTEGLGDIILADYREHPIDSSDKIALAPWTIDTPQISRTHSVNYEKLKKGIRSKRLETSRSRNIFNYASSK